MVSILFEIVPGITAALAAAAVLNIELTVPIEVQHVIITRASARVPMKSNFTQVARAMAELGATAVIYTGVHVIDKVVKELLEGGLPPVTPVAVVHKATWPDQKVVRGTLRDIAQLVKTEGITIDAVIVVGHSVAPREPHRSSVYDLTHTHSHRTQEKTARRQGQD